MIFMLGHASAAWVDQSLCKQYSNIIFFYSWHLSIGFFALLHEILLGRNFIWNYSGPVGGYSSNDDRLFIRSVQSAIMDCLFPRRSANWVAGICDFA